MHTNPQYQLQRTPMASNIYQYLPLAAPTSIRLLCLFPAEDPTSPIHCRILDYNLSNSGETHLYEALSYVWGQGGDGHQHHVVIDGQNLSVTPNLHAALLSLRNAQLQRVLWIDAICINQQDIPEKMKQIELMAQIYSKAARVVVWLGEAENGGDKALEQLRQLASDEIKEGGTSNPEIISLLRRPWFKRIWVLQEVAAARSVTIKCGSAEIDGHAFAVALDSKLMPHICRTSPMLGSFIQPLMHLIKGAVFRQRTIGEVSCPPLQGRPIGELVDMYHNREATIRHDKLFALYGMASENPQPDYSISWDAVLRQLCRSILGNTRFVMAWNDAETVVIRGKGALLGKVVEVDQVAQDGRQIVLIDYMLADYGWSPECPSEATSLPPSVNTVRPGDIVCKLENASNPMIIRPHADFFSVVLITVSLERPMPKEKPAGWMTKNFLIVWDWKHTDFGASDPDAKFDMLIARYDLDHRLNHRLTRGFDMASVFLEKPATLARPVDSPNHDKIRGLLREGVKLAEQEYGRNDRRTLDVKIRTTLYNWDVRELKEVRAKLRRLMEKRLRAEGLYKNLKTDRQSLDSLYKRELEVIGMTNQKGEEENPHACSFEEIEFIDEIMLCGRERCPKGRYLGVVREFSPRTPDIDAFMQDYRAIQGLMDVVLAIKGDGLGIMVHLVERVACHPLGGDMMWYIYSCGLETPFPEPNKDLLLRAAMHEEQGDLMLSAFWEGHDIINLKPGDLEDLVLAGINNQKTGGDVVRVLLGHFARKVRGFTVTKEMVISAAENEEHGESILRWLLTRHDVDKTGINNETLDALTKMGKKRQVIQEILLEYSIEVVEYDEPKESEGSSWWRWLGRGRRH
ncbi:heterokaryon incompatibility protein-domain-containing protein [Cercophora samala]|uniref:Heterokaryon incompatibility protein-domain-containing protein n=1 Tax=Cercophora samala TaxID=330535 RepID=A0AA40DES8_9PEZI|nr:heterokaryon incompatibility protein-domain-containing protein [Cercophora samala]